MFEKRISSAGFLGLIFLISICLISGCSKDRVTGSLYIEYTLSGAWVEEYTIGYWQPSILEWEDDIWVEKDLISKFEFENNSYDLKIFESPDSLLVEFLGDCRVLGDTIFFDRTFHDSIIITESLGFRFLSEDSLYLYSIPYPVNDSFVVISLSGFAWAIPFSYNMPSIFASLSKNSGIFIRQE